MTATHLRVLRAITRLTATDLGKIVGVSHTTIHNWEKGQWPIPAQAVKTLIEEFSKSYGINIQGHRLSFTNVSDIKDISVTIIDVYVSPEGS